MKMLENITIGQGDDYTMMMVVCQNIPISKNIIK